MFYKDLEYKIGAQGYLIAYKDGKGKPLHRQVWEDNYGEIPEGYVIHHKDENRLNNNIDNLQCLTRSEHAEIHSTGKAYCSGRRLSEEHKKKIGEKLRGKKHTEEAKQNMSKGKYKAIKCIETNISYESIKNAAKENNLSESNIVRVLKGKRKTAGGCRWEYV